MRKLCGLLALEMVARDKYAEVVLELKYDKENMEDESMSLTPVLVNGTSGMASERTSIKRSLDLSARSVPWKVEAVR